MRTWYLYSVVLAPLSYTLPTLIVVFTNPGRPWATGNRPIVSVVAALSLERRLAGFAEGGVDVSGCPRAVYDV